MARWIHDAAPLPELGCPNSWSKSDKRTTPVSGKAFVELSELGGLSDLTPYVEQFNVSRSRPLFNAGSDCEVHAKISILSFTFC